MINCLFEQTDQAMKNLISAGEDLSKGSYGRIVTNDKSIYGTQARKNLLVNLIV